MCPDADDGLFADLRRIATPALVERVLGETLSEYGLQRGLQIQADQRGLGGDLEPVLARSERQAFGYLYAGLVQVRVGHGPLVVGVGPQGRRGLEDEELPERGEPECAGDLLTLGPKQFDPRLGEVLLVQGVREGPRDDVTRGWSR